MGFRGGQDQSFRNAGDFDSKERHRDPFPPGWSVLQAAWLFSVDARRSWSSVLH